MGKKLGMIGLGKIEKEEIEDKINQLIKDDHEISFEWITQEELDMKEMGIKNPK